MHVYIRGKRWRFVFGGIRRDADYVGKCDPPNANGKTIRVQSRLRGERRLETIIHELLHAGSWDLDEAAVTEMAKDMGRTLTRLGYCCPAETPE